MSVFTRTTWQCCGNGWREQGERIDPSYTFLKRVDVNDTLSRIIARDPQLTPELLPQDWIGFTAERVCTEYLDFLASLAE